MHEVVTLLNEVADGMPPARLPEDLWRRGRRRRRLRRLGALAAVAALMAGAAFGPAWLLHRPTALTGGPSGTPIVPSFVHPPWLWQATVGQWPPGPAAVLFFTNRTRYLEENGVVIGRNGAYRLVPMTVGEERGLLSPDGRSYVRPGPEPIDLVTGDTRQAGADEWKIRPLAWSPDGRWLLAGRSNGDGFTQYADGGRIVNQPNLQDDLLAVDASTGRSRIVAAGRYDRYDRASWSPDGTAIAVTGPPSEADDRNQLMVLDATTGAPQWRVGLARDERLAGRQAWSPDGTQIAVFTGVDGQADGSIRYRSATDGHLLGPPAGIEGAPGELLGWLHDDPVLTTVRGGNEPRVSLEVLRMDGYQETLVQGPPGSTGMDVPRDLITSGAFGAPDAYPSPLAAAPWMYAAAVIPIILALAWLRRIRRPWPRSSRLTSARP